MKTPNKNSAAKKGHDKAKPKSIAYWKKRVWKLVSEYIRRRAADEAKQGGYAQCCSCGTWRNWKDGDAGHFIDGRHNSIVYDPRNVHFQCKPCNGSFINQKYDRHEIKKRYEEFMVKRYGAEVVEELRQKDKENKQWSIPELQALIETYKSKIKQLP